MPMIAGDTSVAEGTLAGELYVELAEVPNPGDESVTSDDFRRELCVAFAEAIARHANETLDTADEIITTDATITGDLFVGGATALQGALVVAATAQFDGPLVVDGAAAFSETITADDVDVGGDVTIAGAIAVTGPSTLAGTLAVAGLLTASASLDVTGNLAISGTLLVGGASGSGAIHAVGANGLFTLDSTTADNTNKSARFGSTAFVNSQLPVAAIVMATTSTLNRVSIGGNTSTMQAATRLVFLTAAAVNTATGTTRWSVESDGMWLPGANNLYDLGSSSLRPRTLYGVAGNFSGAVTISGALSVSSLTTLSSDLTINRAGAAANADITWAKDDTHVSTMAFRSGGNTTAHNRWIIQHNTAALGNQWSILRRNSSGGAVDTPFAIDWATGELTLGPAKLSSTEFRPNVNNGIALGSSSNRFSTAYVTTITMPGGVTWSVGAGSPEGVVTAPPGSIYTNTSGGAGATMWVKESGTGNTGWVAK